MRIWVVTVNRAQFVVSEWAELMVARTSSNQQGNGQWVALHALIRFYAYISAMVRIYEESWFSWAVLVSFCGMYMMDDCCHWSTNHHYAFSVYLGEFLLLFYLLITYIKLPLYFVFISLSSFYLQREKTTDSYLYISCIYYQLWILMDPWVFSLSSSYSYCYIIFVLLIKVATIRRRKQQELTILLL